MKKLPKVPINGLSKEQQEIFKQFPNDVAQWKEFLQKLGLIVVSLDTYDYPEGYKENLSITYDYDQGFQANLTLGKAIETNLILTAGGFVTAVQFLENKYWPDCLDGTTPPPFLCINFYAKDKAEISFHSSSVGTPLFEYNIYVPFMGTWNEVADVLIRIQKEIADNLKVEKVK